MEGGTQRRRLSVHARKHPHPQPPPCPHKGADTLGGRHKGAHICGRRGTPPPWHTHRCRRVAGRPRPGSGSPHASQRMFPYLACQVSGERASEMQQEPLGGKLELTVPCLALPADSLTEKLFVARAGWPASPPPPPLASPPRAAASRGPRAASAGLQRRCPAPGSLLAGVPCGLSALFGQRGLERQAFLSPPSQQADPGPPDYFCLISAGMRQPRRRRRRGPWAVRAALKGPPPHSARVEV